VNTFRPDRRLKKSTVTSYEETVNFYLYDWLNIFVDSISKQMVAKRFFQIRYKGVQKGKPSHAQAAKTMRVLLALMNYTKGDDLIEFNPVKVLNKNDFIFTFLNVFEF